MSTEEWLKRHAPIESGASLPDGTVVGQWRVAAFVARGGSGEVYRVIDDAAGREAALKILHRDDAAARERFTREMVVMAKLRGGAFPERELRPLRDLRDNYPKTVITLDPMPPSSDDGIRCVNAVDFLLRRA